MKYTTKMFPTDSSADATARIVTSDEEYTQSIIENNTWD